MFLCCSHNRRQEGADEGGGHSETKRKDSKCYGNSWIKPHMFCSLGTLLGWQIKTTAKPCPLSERKYQSMSCVCLRRDKRPKDSIVQRCEHWHRADIIIMCKYRHIKHICNHNKTAWLLSADGANEWGKEVGGGGCCWCHNGMRCKDRRGQINRRPWSGKSRDVWASPPMLPRNVTPSTLQRRITSYSKEQYSLILLWADEISCS